MARTKQTERITLPPDQASQAHEVLNAIEAAQRAEMEKRAEQTSQTMQEREGQGSTNVSQAPQKTQEVEAQSTTDVFNNLMNIVDVNKPTAVRTPLPQRPLTEEEQAAIILEQQQCFMEEEQMLMEEIRSPEAQLFEEQCRDFFENEQAIMIIYEQEYEDDAFEYWTMVEEQQRSLAREKQKQEEDRQRAFEEANQRQEEDRVRREEADHLIAERLQADLERPQRQPLKIRLKVTPQKHRPIRHQQNELDPEEGALEDSDEEEERLTREANRRQKEAQDRRPPQDPAETENRKKMRNDRPPWQGQNIPPPPPTQKHKRRWRPGTVALREIRKYQKSRDPILNKAPFSRLVREVIDKYANRVTRVQSSALECLQEASETILVSLFQDSVLCHAHAKRVTLKPVDLALAMRLRQDSSLHRS